MVMIIWIYYPLRSQQTRSLVNDPSTTSFTRAGP